MGTFKLSLPTDIPWRRVCVSRDMLDPVACDDYRPPRWHSSIAAFRYDPIEEYQPFDDQLISYLKIIVTVAPFQWNEPGVTPRPVFVPEEIFDQVADSHPCYGAVLQVSLSPSSADKDKFPIDRYPYFIDFEPKKRELYEAVSETGEILSGSMSGLSVGKSTTDTHGTEDYNIDMGGGGGFSLGWGLVEANWSGQEQTGTIKRDTRQTQNVRQTDFSTERRELQSHTTQLSQMYNLFQAFHQGTNRALFFMEPRPHIRQGEATFINGPRAQEGIQEVFLIVVRPKEMKEFCIGALLETAHITEKPNIDFTFSNFLEVVDIRPDLPIGSGKMSQVIPVPAGFIVDTTKGTGGFVAQIVEQQSVTELKISVQPDEKSVRVDVTFKHPWEGHIVIKLTVFIRSQNKKNQGEVRRMFLTARELCCCPGEHIMVRVPGWVTVDIDLSEHEWPIHMGPGSPRRFQESRHFASVIRREIIRSFTSPKRFENGTVSYVDSDAFHIRVADILRTADPGGLIDQPIRDLRALDEETRNMLSNVHDSSTAELIGIDAAVLARRVGVDQNAARRLKQALLRAVSSLPGGQ